MSTYGSYHVCAFQYLSIQATPPDIAVAIGSGHHRSHQPAAHRCSKRLESTAMMQAAAEEKSSADIVQS
jgi:hypothetical protein